MARYEIINGPIKVAYGNDNMYRCIFLLVSDTRLQADDSNSRDVNQVCMQQVASINGNGEYLRLFTCHRIRGTTVDRQTMAEFYRRYGVPERQIKDLIRMDRYRHLLEAGNAPRIIGSRLP